MKADQWLKTCTSSLKRAGIPTARLDCLVLLEDITTKNKAYLLANPNYKLSDLQLKKLNKQIKQRSRHEPLAYIRGKTEFYGREFITNKHVLEPRPESETMIELLKDLGLVVEITVLDLGTGCGALAITTKLEIPNSKIIATDIDQNCLKLAQKNAQKHQVAVEFIKGDLMAPFKNRKVDVILANLPYVPDKFKLNTAALNEPKIAIFGGSDGLDVYRKFFEQLSKLNQKPNFTLTEALPFQHQKLAKIARENGYKLQKTDDFIQLFTLS
jgi:release factor glutamine methyltransferase